VNNRLRPHLTWLVQRGLRRGLFEGNQFWLVLGTVAYLLQLAIKVSRRKTQVVFSEPLELGESLVVTHERRLRHNRRRESPFAEP
jgi:hypothetical protein